MRKTKILALCTMLLLLALVAGCGSPSMGVKENKADLTVTVVDGTGAAVSDAVVSVNNDANLTTKTDSTGKCTIKNVTLGGQTVRVSKIGYNDYASANNGVRIVDGANNFPVTLTSNGGGQIKVTVQDALGKSVGKAPVSVVDKLTDRVVASTISNFNGVATLNVPASTSYRVKVAAEDYKMFINENDITVTAGKAIEIPAVIRSDVHPGTITLTAVRLTAAGVYNGALAGVTARIVEANTGLETDAAGTDSATVPAGKYVVGFTLPNGAYENATFTGGTALATSSSIPSYLPSPPTGETVYRLVTVPEDGTATITLQMQARPDVPINTDLIASLQTFTFAGVTPNLSLLLRGVFTNWEHDTPRMPLAEINATSGDTQAGTGTYRIQTLITCTSTPVAKEFKAATSDWSTTSNVTTETFDTNGSGGGNASRMIPGTNQGAAHFTYDAPTGSIITVRGAFNGWATSPSLIHAPIRLVENPSGSGHFEKTVYLDAGTYEYKYAINGDWESHANRSVTVTAGN